MGTPPNIVLSNSLYYVLVHTNPYFMGGIFCVINGDTDDFEYLKDNIDSINSSQKGILIHGVYNKSNLKKIEDAVSIYLEKKHPQDFFLSTKNIDIEKLNYDIKTKNDNKIGEIKEKVVLFKPAKLYKTNKYPWDLYDCTRGVWRIGEKRNIVDYAFTVFNGKIVETYKVISWIEGGKSYRHRLDFNTWNINSRWEFVGFIDYEMRKKYLFKSIDHKYQNPIKYCF